MDRQDAIRKIKAMQNPSGRTPQEVESFKAMAARMMASHGITQSEIDGPTIVDFRSWTPNPQQRTAHEEFMERMRRAASDAEWFTRQANRQAPPQRPASPPPPPRKPTRKAPNRGAFQGTAQAWEVHPDEIKEFMRKHGIRTNGELAGWAGVSASRVSEWMGKGRQRLVGRTMWEQVYVPKILKGLGK